MAFEWVTRDIEARLAQAFFEAGITPRSYYAVGMRLNTWAAFHETDDKVSVFRKYEEAGFFVLDTERFQRDNGSYIVMITFRLPMHLSPPYSNDNDSK